MTEKLCFAGYSYGTGHCFDCKYDECIEWEYYNDED